MDGARNTVLLLHIDLGQLEVGFVESIVLLDISSG
jgi:hypothetical protein